MKRILVLLLMGATPALADDVADLRETMNWIYAKDWANAEAAAARAEDPVIMQVYDWYALRAGQGTYPEYVEFFAENSEWPGLGWLQERGEVFIPENESAENVVTYIENMGPQSDDGLYRYLKALQELGRDKEANAALMDFARSDEISAGNMEKIQALGLSNFDDAAFAQANYQLYEREYGNVGALNPYLSEDEQATIAARIAVLSRADLEPEIPHGGVLYDIMRVYKTDDNYDEAAAVMASASRSREALDDPNYWADDRLDLARNQIWKGNPDLAYELAANHYLEADEKDYAGLEFYAGFVALEFLDDPKLAQKHFNNFKDVANTPISNGRAGYWLGRAGDPDGYEYGAQWQTSFYGQLAAEALGGEYDETLITEVPRDYALRDYLQSDNVRAALYFDAIGEELLARRFMAHESETLPPEDAESLGLLAFDLNMPHTAVHIGKNLAKRGEVVQNSYYPIPDYLGRELPVPAPLALGIMRQESEFYQRAESHVGARGLMQLMPATAQEVSETLEIPYNLDGLKDNPKYNVQLGTKYIRDLLRDFDGKLPVAVLSYNAGPGRGRSWQEHLGAFGTGSEEDAVRWIEQIPFDETRNYVQRVLEGMFIYQAKLQGNFEGVSPRAFLIESYPQGVDWAEVRAEEERLRLEKEREAEEMARKAAAGEIVISLPLARPDEED